MASEPTDGPSEPLDVPDDVSEWIDERASELGVDRDEFVAELLGAHHTIATDGTSPVEDLLDRRFGDLRSELGRDLDDIRRRVVQVKQATDRRAPVDHTHEEFEQLRTHESRLDDLEKRLSELSETVESVSDAVESQRGGGSEQHSEDLDAIDERLDDFEEKLTRVASAVVALRKQGGDGTAERLTTIQRRANREGIETAECGACGEQVSLALLPEPACPHCGTPFGGLHPEGDGAPRLTTPESEESTDE